MSDQLTSFEKNEKKLPAFLNVLTILTLIWCAVELYQTISNFIGGKKAIEEFEKNADKMDQAPAWAKSMMGPEMHEVILKSYDNRIPITIVALIAIGLCVYGALEMRKLKKQGYFLWLAGELLPIVSLLIFIGGVFFKTFMVYFLIFPLLFIILYTVNKKHLTK